MLNLDTHILVYALSGELTRREEEILSGDTWGISAIVIWELCKLSQLGRVEIDLDDVDLRRALSRIQTWSISLPVCRAIESLDFRSDPADELIAATSVVHGVPLVTRDRRIRRSKVVPLV